MLVSVEVLINTIESIAASPKLIYYKVGVTCRPKDRRKTYSKLHPYYRHFVILEGRLDAYTALELEKEIFHIVLNSEQSEVLFKKHAPAHLKSYRPSLGGKNIDNKEEYFLYMTWRSE